MNDLQHKPIDIDRLQRHATDYALEKNLKLFEPGADTGKKVAIVGGGPAGLSAAQYLRIVAIQSRFMRPKINRVVLTPMAWLITR